MAATSLADSTAAFEKQASNLGLEDEWIQGLKRLGIKNLGGLAFACGQPGSPVPEADVRALLDQAVSGKAITVGGVVVMKRLIFEAQTSMVALSRAHADPAADPSGRKMPTAERATRLAAQKLRLTGLDLQGTLEVAHSVYDVINGMVEADTLKYLSPAKCITRMQEITSAKPPKELKLDSSGSGILVKDAQSEQTCSVSGELDIMEAMTRRSLAFDAVGVADFETFQKWIQCLFQMMRQPAPPGFRAPSVTQLLRADRQAFVKMQELTRDGIKPKGDGTRPLDKILEDMHKDHSVVYYMLPTVESQKAAPKAKPDKPEKQNWGAPWKGNESSSWRSPKQGQWKQKKGATGQNGGKLPMQLKGCASTTPDGSRICFGFHIDGCSKADGTAPSQSGIQCKPSGAVEEQPPRVGGNDLKASFDENEVVAAATEIQQQTSRGLLATAGEATETASPFAVEFCSGTGGLTAQLKKAGLAGSFGVDHIVKAGNKAPIVKVDIATPDGEELARSYINSPLCAYAHFGLPCGTSSRAREIALPNMPRAPAPLRNAEHPDGIPDLPAKDAERVAAANRVYAAGCRLIVLCILRGGFATATEVEYPLELCKQWAAIIARVVERTYKGALEPLPSHPDKKARAHSMKQTRKSLAFMPEWSHVETQNVPTMPPFTVGTKLPEAFQQNSICIPQHARILRITAAPHHEQDGGENAHSGVQVAFGVPWSEEGFIEEALKRGHPANLVDGIPKSLRSSIRNNATADFEALVLRIVQDMRDGFSLVGTAEGGGILPAEFQPATLTINDLSMHSGRSNRAVFHSTKSSGNEVVDAELWRKTQAEVEKGWLAELPGLPKDDGRVSRRFAVVQAEDKVRPIDNYTESQINDAVNITGRCTVDGVDTISAMGAELMRALGMGRLPKKLKGRSFDLKSAYRQLAVKDDSLKWARLAVFCPEDRSTRCFQQFSLPFGAKASVVAFLRCARMIQWLAHHLDIPVTCYFDDYVCMAPEAVASNTEKAFELLLDLLGWEFDRSGEKADSMSEQVSALGVVFDLSQSADGVILVANTEKRKVDIAGQIAEILQAGRMTSSKAASLKGRLGFAEGQLFGRAIRRLINELGHHAMHTPTRGTLGDGTRRALEMVADRVVKAGPRRVEEQAIGELEALAVLVAYRLWGLHLKSKHLVCFLDNEGSRFLILKGYSSNKVLESIVHEIALCEEELSSLAWYARVPTEANVADHPSRLREHAMLQPQLESKVKNLAGILERARSRGWEALLRSLAALAHPPPMDPADHQLVAQLQTLQRVVAFQQLVRAALIHTDDVGDSLETHSFTNRNWENRVEQARLTFR
ncbi:unnamed protein product, partial [Cladocopium goreaui]